MSKFTTLGDPHLGRRFRTGVPLHRVGDRERLQWQQFARALNQVDTPYHVMMGDLFDRFVVPPEIVLRAAEIYREAAGAQRGTTFVVLMGNHDVSRDTTKASSFDLFAQLVAGVPNIQVVKDEPWVSEGMGFVPYTPFLTAEEFVERLPDNLEVVFGHWDIVDWGGPNVIPTKLLAEKGVDLAISGHDHVARTERRHGVDVIVTGSMQPYTHAEDKTGEWYITTGLPIEGDVTNKNVRVVLKPGETLPEDLDCLSLTAKREADEQVEVDTSDFDSLDISQMLARALDDLSIKDELMEAFHHA